MAPRRVTQSPHFPQITPRRRAASVQPPFRPVPAATLHAGAWKQVQHAFHLPWLQSLRRRRLGRPRTAGFSRHRLAPYEAG